MQTYADKLWILIPSQDTNLLTKMDKTWFQRKYNLKNAENLSFEPEF